MSNVYYDGDVVNSVIDRISQISNTVPNISSGIRSATNQIISAKGFQKYVGGISSDSFSGVVDQCQDSINNFSKEIRQKQVSVLSYSKDTNDINTFLNSLSRSEFDSLDLSELDFYIDFNRKAGNVMKGIGATVGTFGMGILEGLGNLLETGADLVVLGVSGAATIFTGAADWITGGHTTQDMWEGTKAFVSDKKVENIFNSFYNDTEVGRSLKENAYLFEGARSVGSGLGYTAGLIGLNILTGGVASGLGVGAAGSVTPAGLALSAGTLGFSRGTQDAWADGATIENGLAYGVASGAWEGLQWYAGAKINQYGGLGDKVAQGIFKGAASGVGTRIAMDSVDNALEGFVQPALTMIYKDYGQGDFVENYKIAFEQAGGWSNVGTLAVAGGVMSGASEYFGARRFLKAANTTDDVVDDAARKIFDSEGGDGSKVTQQIKKNYDEMNTVYGKKVSEIEGLDDLLDTTNDELLRKTKVDSMKFDTSNIVFEQGQAGGMGSFSRSGIDLRQAQADLDSFRRYNNINVNDPNRVISSSERILMQKVENARSGVNLRQAQADLDSFRKYNNINVNDPNRVISSSERALMQKVENAKASQIFNSDVSGGNGSNYYTQRTRNYADNYTQRTSSGMGRVQQYSSSSDVFRNVDDPLTTDKVRKVASMFDRNPNADYQDLIVLNSKGAKQAASIQVENAFKNRFNISNGYSVTRQDDYFIHVKQLKNYDFNVESRLYINVDNYNDAYKFALKFADECESNGMGYYFKTGVQENGRILKNLTSYRDDAIVIYCSNDKLADYANVVNRVVKQNGISLSEPPVLAGKLKGTNIGFGAEPIKYSGIESYNTLRMKVIQNAHSHVESTYRQYGITKNSSGYYEYLKRAITNEGRKWGIDPKNFCFEI